MINFFKKLLNFPKEEIEKQEDFPPEEKVENLSLDQLFVSNFIKKEGKFLYCTSLAEVTESLSDIIEENQWSQIVCNDYDLLKLVKAVDVKVLPKFNAHTPIFVSCEYLIAENGSVLFSSNQLKRNKIASLSPFFIVYATTSQIARTKNDSLTGIKLRYGSDIPSNISAIKNYNPSKSDEDFLNFGTTNAKNVYLILFEDL